MVETKPILERVYVIPLRKEWVKVPYYKRARKGVVAVKEFIARHMKVPDRDTSKVKLDVYLNNEMWFRGPKYSPSKIKVKAIKEGDIVKVTFVEVPKHVAFEKAKHERFHKKAEKKKEEPKVEDKKEEKTEEQKKEEAEKEKSTAIVKEHQLEQQAKIEKHVTKPRGPEIKRMSLKK